MLLAFEYGVHFFQGLSFRFHPEYSLFRVNNSPAFGESSESLTMSIKVIMSHDPLIMYIFQPILSRPIGMMKTSNSLRWVSQRIHDGKVYIAGEITHARPLSVNCEKATPFALVG